VINSLRVYGFKAGYPTLNLLPDGLRTNAQNEQHHQHDRDQNRGSEGGSHNFEQPGNEEKKDNERADDDREFHLITPWIRQPGE